MGAYGSTAEASKSYFGKPPCEVIVAGDINGDCIVNSLDFALMAAQWLRRQFAAEPYPSDGALIRPRGGTFPLSWSPGSDAVSHDIYLGLDYTVLRNAGRSSPEFKANQSAASFTATGLDPSTTYYWRIDEIAADGAITGGYIWSFTTTSMLR